ncbi:MAG: hypothetical protein PHS95_00720 [Candidatus Pacebacteria bacterium]|nr:hypothetical protein [Candidatus Paceibacterota bacterium]
MDNIPTPQKPTTPVAPVPPKETPKEYLGFTPKVIRTMRSDMVEAIKGQNGVSGSSVAPADAKRIAIPPRPQIPQAPKAPQAPASAVSAPVPTPARPSAPVIKVAIEQSTPSHFLKRTMIVMLVLLILIGGGWATYKYIFPRLTAVNFSSISFPTFGFGKTPEPITPVPLTPVVVTPPPPLIVSQSEKRFTVNSQPSQDLFSMVSTERTLGGSPDEIKNLDFVEEVSGAQGIETKTVPLSRIITLSGVSTPDILVRSIEKSMVGLLGENTSYTPFIVLKVSAYDTGFAGMLAWEQNLPRFFDAVFGTRIAFQATAKLKFRDVVIATHDARVLGGTPDLTVAYMFVDPETIIVAGSTTALEKLAPLVSTK